MVIFVLKYFRIQSITLSCSEPFFEALVGGNSICFSRNFCHFFQVGLSPLCCFHVFRFVGVIEPASIEFSFSYDERTICRISTNGSCSPERVVAVFAAFDEATGART